MPHDFQTYPTKRRGRRKGFWADAKFARWKFHEIGTKDAVLVTNQRGEAYRFGGTLVECPSRA
jgi:hypothetical protein